MNHLGDTNKMVDDKTIIEWNADVGTRFLTIYPDGSFHINQNTPPLYALGELAKAFIKQQDRIKRLEEAGDKIVESGWSIQDWSGMCVVWAKAKEAKL
jgi:hypothetical protein